MLRISIPSEFGRTTVAGRGMRGQVALDGHVAPRLCGGCVAAVLWRLTHCSSASPSSNKRASRGIAFHKLPTHDMIAEKHSAHALI